MGTTASLFLDQKVFLVIVLLLPFLAWLAPPQFALIFTLAVLWLALSSHTLERAMSDADVPDKLAAYRKQLYGMMIVVSGALILMALITYFKMRRTVVGPMDGNAELIGLYDGYRGFRVGYAVVITVFSVLYGLLQTQRSLASSDSFELTKMQHVEAMWVGNHASNLMGSLITLWTTTLLLLAVAPSTVVQNLKPLLGTLGDLRTAAGAI